MPDNAHPATNVARRSGGLKRDGHAVARHHVAFAQAAHMHLQSLDRGIDIPRGAACRRFFAEHIPRFDRLPQFEFDAVVGTRP